jgi:hypothetical protein
MSDNPAASSELVTRAWRNWRCFSEGGYLSLVGTVITFFYEEHSNNLFNKVSALMDFASFLRFGGLMTMHCNLQLLLLVPMHAPFSSFFTALYCVSPRKDTKPVSLLTPKFQVNCVEMLARDVLGCTKLSNMKTQNWSKKSFNTHQSHTNTSTRFDNCLSLSNPIKKTGAK